MPASSSVHQSIQWEKAGGAPEPILAIVEIAGLIHWQLSPVNGSALQFRSVSHCSTSEFHDGPSTRVATINSSVHITNNAAVPAAHSSSQLTTWRRMVVPPGFGGSALVDRLARACQRRSKKTIAPASTSHCAS